ncbi:MAG: hypothetical protein ACOC5S_05485 [Acidobacteriota bacterium]
MPEKIKKRYVSWIDCYGKRHTRHQADGICQMCGKAEGVQIGDKIRCFDCFDKIVEEVEREQAESDEAEGNSKTEKAVVEQFMEPVECPTCKSKVHTLLSLPSEWHSRENLCANCFLDDAFSRDWIIDLEVEL